MASFLTLKKKENALKTFKLEENVSKNSSVEIVAIQQMLSHFSPRQKNEIQYFCARRKINPKCNFRIPRPTRIYTRARHPNRCSGHATFSRFCHHAHLADEIQNFETNAFTTIK